MINVNLECTLNESDNVVINRCQNRHAGRNVLPTANLVFCSKICLFRKTSLHFTPNECDFVIYEREMLDSKFIL